MLRDHYPDALISALGSLLPHDGEEEHVIRDGGDVDRTPTDRGSVSINVDLSGMSGSFFFAIFTEFLLSMQFSSVALQSNHTLDQIEKLSSCQLFRFEYYSVFSDFLIIQFFYSVSLEQSNSTSSNI